MEERLTGGGSGRVGNGRKGRLGESQWSRKRTDLGVEKGIALDLSSFFLKPSILCAAIIM